MKKLLTSSINNTVGFPVKSGTIDFLQLAYQEAITAIANNLVGAKTNTTDFFILYGCKNSGTGLNYNISAGAILYSGEVFLVPAAVFTAPGGQVAVGNFLTAFYTTNADPVLFTDGVNRNVHQVKTMTFAAGVSGSGASDFSTLINTQVVLKNAQTATLPASYIATFKEDKAEFFAAATVDCTVTFSFTGAIPGTVVRLKWAYGAGRALSVVAGSGQTVIKDSGNLANVASATNVLYMIYLGKNEAGNDEVSYTLIQA
jgi:hypothetical protein